MSNIEIKNLECVRRDNVLFQDINFILNDGDLFQIDGVNGSGKSSLLRICTGLVQPTEGAVYWNGEDVKECRYQYQSDISYIGHSNGVKESLTAAENFNIMRTLSLRKTDIDAGDVLEQIGLPEMADLVLNRMSAGQKRRIALARLIITNSKLWLLDEPFTSLDEAGKSIIEKLIVKHCNAGGMVIFATHQAMEIGDYPIQHIHLGNNNE